MVKDVMCSKPPPLPPLPGLARAPAGTGRAIVVYALCLEVVGAQAGANPAPDRTGPRRRRARRCCARTGCTIWSGRVANTL